MKDSSKRFSVCVALVTVGIVLILSGMRVLFFVGLAFVMTAAFFTQRRNKSSVIYVALAICAAGLGVDLVLRLHRGDLFERRPYDAWAWGIFIAAWLWSVGEEFCRWRANRNVA